MQAFDRICLSWPTQLDEYFARAGLKEVSRGIYDTAPETRGFFTHIQCMVETEFSRVAMNNEGPDSVGSKHRQRILGAAHELQQGAAIRYKPEVTIGKKAGL